MFKVNSIARISILCLTMSVTMTAGGFTSLGAGPDIMTSHVLDAAPLSSSGNPIVKIGQGDLEGVTRNGVDDFFGIPYAAPPTGERRWSPPLPPDGWAEVRDASEYGSACPQIASLDSVRVIDENCLFVNVQRPEGATSGSKLPVIVLFHGGGWVSGSGNNENLSALVRENHVVGVTMNYRLGNLGFLTHPSLAGADGDISNYGLMDQLAALEWVKENVAAFGGDPSAVTIGGESAGGGTVCQMLASPKADGLYVRAFMMSALCQAVPREQAETQGEKIASLLGCESDTAACLRALPVDSLIDSTVVFSRPVDGTSFLPVSGAKKLQLGDLTEVPLLIGANRNEGRSFLTNWADRSARTFTQQEYEEFVQERFGQGSQDVMAIYPYPENITRYSGSYVVAEIMGVDFLGKPASRACSVNHLTELSAKHGNVWSYEFAPDGGPGWFEVPGYIWGTGHATDLPYLIPDRGNFANNGAVLSKAHKLLATSMIAYWGNFIKTGNPNGNGEMEWPQYQSGAGPILQLREGGKTSPISLSAFSSAQHCDFWNSLGSGK